MKNIIKYGFVFLLSVVVLTISGCEKSLDRNISVEESDMVEVTFSYSIPSLYADIDSKGYIGTDAKWSEISTIDVLVYQVQADGTEELVYHRNAYDIQNGTFKVMLAKSDEKHTFDFLFNTASYIEYELFGSGTMSSLRGNFNIGDSREKVRQEFVYTSNPPQLISSTTCPMWGELEDDTPIPILHDVAITDKILVMRSMCALDIGVNMDNNYVSQGLSNFVLQSVSAVYCPTWNLIIPDKNNIVNGVATAPSLADNYSFNNSYIVLANLSQTTDGTALGIAIFEPNMDSGSNIFSIVICGHYTDDNGTTFNNQYYKVDIMDPNNPTDKLKFIRNYRYTINIVKVTGIGASSAMLAVNSSNAAKAELLIPEANIGKINYVVHSQSAYLGVNEIEFNFTATQTTSETLNVVAYAGASSSSFTRGWRITCDESWVKFNGAATNANSGTTTANPYSGDILLTVDQNTTGNPRSAIAHIYSGQSSTSNYLTLVLPITITQY
ncbi:MAG: hypothetical protein LUF90_01405 [Rikenellaceae bacterium]|nr:hypothetical protein [Rikenellaceae bacterium]